MSLLELAWKKSLPSVLGSLSLALRETLCHALSCPVKRLWWQGNVGANSQQRTEPLGPIARKEPQV